MIFSSCICCCSYFILCSSEAPDIRACKICGLVGLIISLMAAALFVGWVGMGTYFITKINNDAAICNNTITYLTLLYVYLLVGAMATCVVLGSRCYDWMVYRKTHSGRRRRSLRRKEKGKLHEYHEMEES